MEEPLSEETHAILECVKVGRNLRVRIISNGYHNEANTQFPKAIRVEGRKYKVPRNVITFGRGSNGKFFYRVNNTHIRKIEIIEPDDSNSSSRQKHKINKIYEDEDDPICIICMDNPKNVVIVPCGHYNLCQQCLELSGRNCPTCRGPINAFATIDQIQLY